MKKLLAGVGDLQAVLLYSGLNGIGLGLVPAVEYLLFGIELFVRLSDELGSRDSLGGTQCTAGTYGYLRDKVGTAFAQDVHLFLNSLAYLGVSPCYQHEFVTAVPCTEAVQPVGNVVESICNELQGTVACDVTEFVVDLFEIVDVHNVYPERLAFRGIVYHVLQKYFHAPTVVKSCERIGIDLTVLYLEKSKQYRQKNAERYYR